VLMNAREVLGMPVSWLYERELYEGEKNNWSGWYIAIFPRIGLLHFVVIGCVEVWIRNGSSQLIAVQAAD